MGGEGSIQAMRNILKNNKNLLRGKRYFKKERAFSTIRRAHVKAARGIVDVNKATKEELLAIRKKIIAQRRRVYIYTIFLTLLIAPPLFYLGYQFLDIKPTTISVQKQEDIYTKNNKFDFFINDGDAYLKKGQWHNSIFQYNKAIALYPSNYSAHYRLAYAYTYRCRNTKTNCAIAEKKVKQLLEKYPDYLELIELEQVLVFVEK